MPDEKTIGDIYDELALEYLDLARNNLEILDQSLKNCKFYDAIITYGHISFQVEKAKKAADNLEEIWGERGREYHKKARTIETEATDKVIIMTKFCECKKRD